MNLISKAFLYLNLILLSGICTGQTRCLPSETYANLVHDAYRSYVQDSLISELQGKVSELQAQLSQSSVSHARIVSNFELQIDALTAQKDEQREISEAWRKQARKKQNESKWLKAGIVAAFVGGLLIPKVK